MNKKKQELNNSETYAYYDEGQGEVILLIHGNLSSSGYYLPLIKNLSSSFRTIAVDLRGFGDSTYNRRIKTLKDFADDIKLFLDSLNIKKVYIAGWSLGGGVAMEFASHYQDYVNKLILINSTTHKGYPIFKKDKNFNPILTEVYTSPEELANDPIQVKPVLDALKSKKAEFMKYVYDLTIYTNKKPDLTENEFYISETLKQQNLIDADFALASLNMSNDDSLYSKGMGNIKDIKVPVLHIWGTLDKTVPEYMVLDNINAIPGQSTYIKFNECGHSPIVDKLEELSSELIKFIIS